MKIKELSQRITFCKRHEIGRDSEGFPKYRTDDIFSTWAKAEKGGTNESETNNATFDDTMIIFTIRYRSSPEITGDMLIRHSGKEYEIIGIELVDFERKYLKISAKRMAVQS